MNTERQFLEMAQILLDWPSHPRLIVALTLLIVDLSAAAVLLSVNRSVRYMAAGLSGKAPYGARE